MKKTRFTDTQIVAILNEAETGMKVKDLCLKHGISDATYYNWKSKYFGMSASELKRTQELEAENTKLKRVYADLALENWAMKDLALNPREKLAAAQVMLAEHGLAIRRGCDCVGLSRAAFTDRRWTGRHGGPSAGCLSEYVCHS